MRSLILLAAVAFAAPGHADEVEVRSRTRPAEAMRNIRRVEVGPTNGEVVRTPWARGDAEIVATKTAADKAALEALRIHVALEGDRLSITVGENLGGVWTPLRSGSKVDLTIRLPARLIAP
jgi:hypothetical protein